MFKSKLLLSTLIAIFVIMLASTSFAEKRVVQLSLFNPIQIFSEGDNIEGLRFNFLYGKNTTVTGLDFGLINHTTSGLSKGVQFGLVGLTEGDFMGFQNNFFNITKGNFEGFQWGLFNSAGHASGFQLGLVNYARTMKGLQIGLINIIKQGGQFPVFPFINWSF